MSIPISRMTRERLGSAAAVIAVLAAMGFLWGPQLHQNYQHWRTALANERLLKASAVGDIHAAATAITAGADIETRNRSGKSALDTAIAKKDVPLITLLINAEPSSASLPALILAIES
jgi:hypothetical protein